VTKVKKSGRRIGEEKQEGPVGNSKKERKSAKGYLILHARMHRRTQTKKEQEKRKLRSVPLTVFPLIKSVLES